MSSARGGPSLDEGGRVDAPPGAPAPGAAAALASRPLVHHFLDRARDTGGAVAFRSKDLGIWQEVTWSAYRRRVEHLARGLHGLGVGRGDRVAVLAGPSPAWLCAELAVQSLGALVVGLYPTTPPDELRQLLDTCGPGVLVAGGHDDLAQLVASGHRGVTHVVLVEPGGALDAGGRHVVGLAELEAAGEADAARDPGAWERGVAEAGPDDPVGVFCTLGTTGPPKGVVLTSRNLVLSLEACFADGRPPGRADRTVARLPLAHVLERQLSVYAPVLYGSVAHLPEDAATVRAATIEAQPTLLAGYPGDWEAAAGQVQVGLEQSGRLERAVLALAVRARRGALRARWAGERPSPPARLAAWAAYWAICRQVLDKFGYPQLDLVLTTGAPLPAAVAEAWQLWGVELRDVYGLTEAAGPVALQPANRPGAGPRPLGVVEAQVADDGELLVRGPTVFAGYAGGGPATDAEGWFATGDLARWDDDGGLRLLGRKEELLRLGDRVVAAPAVEQQLRASPYLREAVVLELDGEAVALVELDARATAGWARERGLGFTGYGGLADAPAVRELVAGEVARANEALADAGLPVVADHRLLASPLDPEAGDEVTALRTPRRGPLVAKHRARIEEMGRRPAAGTATTAPAPAGADRTDGGRP